MLVVGDEEGAIGTKDLATKSTMVLSSECCERLEAVETVGDKRIVHPIFLGNTPIFQRILRIFALDELLLFLGPFDAIAGS